MTYELAKKLKHANFQAEEYVTEMYFDSSLPIGEADLPNPTLSELIEACGISFFDLRRYVDKNSLVWAASGIKSWGNYEIGSTPEEAVANLWLELNKHGK